LEKEAALRKEQELQAIAAKKAAEKAKEQLPIFDSETSLESIKKSPIRQRIVRKRLTVITTAKDSFTSAE
jgi:hypothetical protein